MEQLAPMTTQAISAEDLGSADEDDEASFRAGFADFSREHQIS